MKKVFEKCARETGRFVALVGFALATASLSACALASPAPLKVHTRGELYEMSPSQRLDYLSEAYQFASNPDPKDRYFADRVFNQAIAPTYRAILAKDGPFVAAAVFAVVYADTLPADKLNYRWAPKVKAEALADPGMASMFSGRQFAPVVLGFEASTARAGVESEISQALFAVAAHNSDPRACEWLSTSPKLPNEVMVGCAQVASSGQAHFQAVVDDQQQEQAAREEAKRRWEAAKPIDIQQALAVQRRCAEVGVPSPVIDVGKVEYLRSNGSEARPLRPSVVGLTDPRLIDAYINDLATAMAARSEASAVTRGSAITPYLTPRFYVDLVKAQCGIQ